MTSVRIPISNFYAKGGYTARLLAGSQQTPVNLILDSGSSVMALRHSRYDARADTSLSATSLLQHVRYGKGGWHGPVVTTEIAVGQHEHGARLREVSLAIADETDTGCFLDADGIIGLAYTPLDHGVDVSQLLADEVGTHGKTYPLWFERPALAGTLTDEALKTCPSVPITPYFTQLEEQGIVANQFALYTHRSSIYHCEATQTGSHYAHHLNHGLFVVGKPHIHQDLHTGRTGSVEVLSDNYYNTEVTGIRVGDNPVRLVASSVDKPTGHKSGNAIIDSGASFLVLPERLFKLVRQDLAAGHPDFAAALAAFDAFTGQETGVPLADLNIDAWPSIEILLNGCDGNTVTLTLSPHTYWQVHAPKRDQATFKLCWLPEWGDTLILGLPLLNNYYTVFDRSAGPSGRVDFYGKRDLAESLRQGLHRIFHPASKESRYG
ncbi:pepsin-like aspartic protease [Alteromonas sp. CYL-A6]|uniref:pepsin-like aspartic protease n=1 Tax=Alteromonas nitratireducens TaxID=3390813 RepID=UPI0034C2F021